MIKSTKYFIVVIFLLIGVSSCKYQRLLKSSDTTLKYEKAKEYYDEGNYAKAMTLYEQLVPIYRGTEKGEEISYYFAHCNYNLKDYIMAGHYFNKFANSFPNSKYTEECSFLSAYCYYLDSPKTSLDQESTYKAISEIQLYLGRYPDTERMEQCNELLDELRKKLEVKSYDNAFLYYKIYQYKAAAIALKSSLEQFPETDSKEDILYYTLKSSYNYAINSVYDKAKSRLEVALKDYKTFVKNFPESEYNKDVNRIHESIIKKLEPFN
ncbi:MAG: outer membrane protein assembly factor BamD [Bacteroidales bacterium]|nr:outer membrane protein assembly factor BamD [Bacteroidales bacterium]MBN2758682.1 outer membrane protein assembly factor BamD [Bacteroidales bacterium]